MKLSVVPENASPAYSYPDREDQAHNVDGVRRTKAGKDSQTKVATEGRRGSLLCYRSTVQKCAPTQGAFNLRIKDSERHRFATAWR